MANLEAESGFTKRIYLALIYTVVIFVPAFIYLDLATGTWPSGVEWFSLLFIVEIARSSGKPLNKNEALVLFVLAGGLIIPQLFPWRIYTLWLRKSAITNALGIGGDVGPWWFAPQLSTGLWETRTFLNSAWIVPILIPVIATVVSSLGAISLGLFFKDAFIKVEKLPFPIQEMQVEGILTVTEHKKGKIEILSIAAIIGFIFGFTVYTLRFIANGLKISLPLVPIPWVDLNRVVEAYFPGASFGLATDISPYTFGFILPLHIAAGTFIGSFAIYFIGSWISVSNNIYIQPWWSPGMNIALCMQRSLMYLWANPLIGIAVAAGLMPLILRPKILLQSLRIGKSRIKDSDQTYLSSKWILLYIACAIVGTILIIITVPDLPFWIPLLANLCLPIVITLVSARVLGTTGQWFVPTNLNEIVIYASGYQGTSGWFSLQNASWLTYLDGSGWIARSFMCERIKTDIMSLIKAFMFVIPLVLLVSFIFTQMFWSLAEIPSDLFPGAQIYWPIRATMFALWTTRPEGLFNPFLILGSFGVTAALTAIPIFVGIIPAGLSIAFAAGTALSMPWATAILIGNIVYVILEKIFGKYLSENKFIIAAGLGMGQGIAVVFGVCIALILGSMWVLPF